MAQIDLDMSPGALSSFQSLRVSVAIVKASPFWGFHLIYAMRVNIKPIRKECCSYHVCCYRSTCFGNCARVQFKFSAVQNVWK